MPLADNARREIVKLPPRPSERMRKYAAMVNIGVGARARETKAWLHKVHGDEAKGITKAEVRRALGLTPGASGREDQPDDGGEVSLDSPQAEQAARFLSNEQLMFKATIEDPVSRGMPRAYLDGLSDIEFALTTQLFKDTAIAMRWEVHGRHTGPLLGVPPTEKQVTVTGITVLMFDEELNPEGPGRVSRALEEWTYWDLPGLAAQIGATP